MKATREREGQTLVVVVVVVVLDCVSFGVAYRSAGIFDVVYGEIPASWGLLESLCCSCVMCDKMWDGCGYFGICPELMDIEEMEKDGVFQI